MANAFFYSSTAVQTTLSGSISNSALSATVLSTVGWPISYPYVAALDYGGAAEELVVVTNNSAGTLTITRGFDSTSAQSHSAGAVVRLVYCANDATAFRTHEASTGAVHGLAGNIVGDTDTQTLSNKTLTNPTINAATLTGTLAGAPTFSGNVAFTGLPTFSQSVALNGGFTWTGTATGTGSEVINANAVGTVPLTANGFTGQTANLQNWQVNGSTLAFMSSIGTLNAVGLVLSAPARNNASAVGTVTWASLVSGDGFDRHRIYGDGKQEWGPGNGARDTNLYRSAVGTLTTDGTLAVGSGFSVTAGIGQVILVQKPASTGRTVVGPVSDPDLTFTLPAGSWDIEATIGVYSGASGHSITAWFQHPTMDATLRGVGVVGPTLASYVNVNTGSSAGGNFVVNASSSGTTEPNVAIAKGRVTVSSSGTFAFFWGPDSTTAVNVAAGSFITATRVA